MAGGSSGWQAPEQLFSRSGEEVRQGKSVDVFSFGLVLFYCLTGGRHAFGESYERDFNIMQVPPLPTARMTCGHLQQACMGGAQRAWRRSHSFTDATMAAARLAADKI